MTGAEKFHFCLIYLRHRSPVGPEAMPRPPFRGFVSPIEAARAQRRPFRGRVRRRF